jgi:hypothetical protein
MAIDLTAYAATLQAKLDALSDANQAKEFLLLAKAFEATLGGFSVLELREVTAELIAQIQQTGTAGSAVSITPSGPLTATNAQAAFVQLLSLAQLVSQKNQPNGYAGLDAGGRLTSSQLPEEVLGAMNYRGTWNAATNTPAIPAASSANKGWYYVVATDGTTNIDGTAVWHVGDWIVSNGSKWDKIDSTDQVTSVVGLQGNISKVALLGALELAAVAVSGSASDLSSGTLPVARLAAAVIPYGRQTIPVVANAMTARAASAPSTGAVLLANNILRQSKDFDTSTKEFAQFAVQLPKQLDESATISFRAWWTAASGTGGVAWSLAVRATSDGDAIAGAMGTAVTVTDVFQGANIAHRTDESAPITIGNAFIEGDMLWFELAREVADPVDVLPVDAMLLGIELYVTTNAGSDA